MVHVEKERFGVTDPRGIRMFRHSWPGPRFRSFSLFATLTSSKMNNHRHFSDATGKKRGDEIWNEGLQFFEESIWRALPHRGWKCVGHSEKPDFLPKFFSKKHAYQIYNSWQSIANMKNSTKPEEMTLKRFILCAPVQRVTDDDWQFGGDHFLPTIFSDVALKNIPMSPVSFSLSGNDDESYQISVRVVPK